MKILVLDNYDSFVYNLIHILREAGASYDIAKNDEISIEDVAEYDKILFSPGPGLPEEAGIMMQIIDHFHKSKSMLGVCLGHQAIGAYFQGRLRKLDAPLHGYKNDIQVDNSNPLFLGLKPNIEVGHYHSWVVDINDQYLYASAVDSDENVMALNHRTYPLYGVQFHPESIMTPEGKRIIENWLAIS